MNHDRPTSRVETLANLALREVLIKARGVDGFTLGNLIALKNVLAADFLRENGGVDRPTPEFLATLVRELTETAANQSAEIKARECAETRERRFGAYPGFVPSPALEAAA